MRNCLVIGSGRSGTSMVAGAVAGAGYYWGSTPLNSIGSTDPTNPKGNFEDVQVNDINEAILAPHFPPEARTRWGRARQRRRVLQRGLRWAAALPLDLSVDEPSGVGPRLTELVVREPFCFKDPRLCYTLPVWRPYIGDAVFICVFREPSRTAQSILTDWHRKNHRYPMTYERALAYWRCAYDQVLKRHRAAGEWLFVHYDQVLDGSGLARVEQVLDATVDRTFPDRSLKRSPARGALGPAEAEAYAHLCSLAGYADGG